MKKRLLSFGRVTDSNYLVCFSLCFPKEEGGQCKCNVGNLKERKRLLQKYIDDDTSRELQALYAVQALFVQLDYPPGKACCRMNPWRANVIIYL